METGFPVGGLRTCSGSHRPLARRTHEPAILLAFLAHAVQELLPHGGMVAVAHRVHEASAVAAEMLHRPLLRDVPLVGHEEAEDQDEEADDDRDGEALEASLGRLEGEGRPGDAHGPAWGTAVKALARGQG